MKYFQQIPKEWKEQGTVERCSQCNSDLEKGTDRFHLQAHWKIKDTADRFQFCSLGCVQKWAKEDTLVAVR